MIACAVLSLLLQVPAVDPIRSAAAAENVVEARTDQADELHRRVSDARVREFQQKFNRLVDAVEAFGRKYNEGKGHVWPKREADALREALTELAALPEFQPPKEP